MEQKLEMFFNRLSKMHKHYSKIARKTNISCYRIYDLDLPEFPLAIDIYENHVHVAEYKRNHTLTNEEYQQWLDSSLMVISKILNIPLENIHVKLRKIIEDRKEQYTKWGDDKRTMIVHEGNLSFIVNLDDYLDTGLFLDHRITREMVKALSHHKNVLNLFAYTGAFSVYAAAGGAKEVHTVDLSNTYLDWAKSNMKTNNFDDEKKYTYQAIDVLAIIPLLPKVHYDIIVLDPPTFSNSKKMKDVFDIQRDHTTIINHCINLLTEDGVIFFSTNFTKFKIDEESIKGKIKDITRQTIPFDFQKMVRFCFKISK